MPQIATWPSLCIFNAIIIRNPDILQEVIDFRGIRDYNLKSSEGLSPIESAAKYNFPEGIEILCNSYVALRQKRKLKLPFFFKDTSPLKVAIWFKSTNALTSLVHEIVKYGSLDYIYSIADMIKLINQTITTKNSDALKVILENIVTKTVKYFHNSSELYNPIQNSIKCDFMEGFDLLVEHFGCEILGIKNVHEKNAFLFAILLGKYHFVNKMPHLNNQIIFDLDRNGNNALHLAIRLHHSFDNILQLVNLGIPLNAPNFNEQTPLDYILKEVNRFTTDQMFILLKTRINQ